MKIVTVSVVVADEADNMLRLDYAEAVARGVRQFSLQRWTQAFHREHGRYPNTQESLEQGKKTVEAVTATLHDVEVRHETDPAGSHAV